MTEEIEVKIKHNGKTYSGRLVEEPEPIPTPEEIEATETPVEEQVEAPVAEAETKPKFKAQTIKTIKLTTNKPLRFKNYFNTPRKE